VTVQSGQVRYALAQTGRRSWAIHDLTLLAPTIHPVAELRVTENDDVEVEWITPTAPAGSLCDAPRRPRRFDPLGAAGTGRHQAHTDPPPPSAARVMERASAGWRGKVARYRRTNRLTIANYRKGHVEVGGASNEQGKSRWAK